MIAPLLTLAAIVGVGVLGWSALSGGPRHGEIDAGSLYRAARRAELPEVDVR